MQLDQDKIKNRSQLVYSVFLIILIPAMMIFNIFWTWRNINLNIDSELHQKAILANNVIASLVDQDTFANSEIAQSKLDLIKKNSPEVVEVSLMQKQEEGFFIFASTTNDRVGKLAEGYQADIAWKELNPVAIISSYETDNKVERVWSVTSIVRDGNTKIGLIDTKVSLASMDAMTQESLQQSLIILIVTIIIILLLLVNHFRFFEWALLARKLQEIDKMKDDFISIASHELKTPVAAIRGYIDNISAGVGGKVDEEGQKTLGIIAAQTERLNNLVNDLLNVSRLEQGRLEFAFKPINISQMVLEVTQVLSVQAKEKNLELNYNQEQAQNINISADENRLREILTNIIGNAIKYTKKGSVEIYHQVDGNNIKTIIKDTGVGMSPEARAQLFTKFYRIRNDATKEIPGTGLGLWITKQMVEKMKGQIYVDSMENVGSQFVITFPIVK